LTTKKQKLYHIMDTRNPTHGTKVREHVHSGEGAASTASTFKDWLNSPTLGWR
jgi:hypothetical protein